MKRVLSVLLIALLASPASGATVSKNLNTSERSASTITTDPVVLDNVVVGAVTANIVGDNTGNKTFVSGVLEVQTLTFPAKAAATDGDYIVFYQASGNGWAVALDTTGSAPAPTGAIWTAIPAGRKSNCDISGTTDAASVAAAVELCADALTGLTDAITTDDSAANGTMLLTQVTRGPTTDPVPKSEDDAGAGSILGVQTTAGVTSNVDLDAETATIASHAYLTGTKITLTTSSSLPTGVSTSTDYYIIAVSANTISFASSQANALAGTAINLTGFGAGTQTVAVTTALAGSVKLQKSVEPDGTAPVWIDIADSSTNFSAAGGLNWSLPDIGYRKLRAVVTVTSGTVLVTVSVNAKGWGLF